MEDNNYEQKSYGCRSSRRTCCNPRHLPRCMQRRSIQKKLEKAGYTCTSYEAGKDDDGASIEWKVVAKKNGLNADYVTVTKFAETDDAKEYESSVPTASVGGIKLVVKRIGKVCYYGTEQGVKDAQ